MTAQFSILRPLLVVGLVSGGLAATPARAADVAPVRLYLHSASGDYAQDAVGAMPYTAPVGSTMSKDKPARPTSAVAAHRHGLTAPGSPTIPTFRSPVAGTVRGMCIDLFIASTRLTPNPPAADGLLYVNTRFYAGGAGGTSVETNAQTFEVGGNGATRVTGWAPAKGAPFDITEGMPLVLHGLTLQNPGWTLYYDSAEHFSSIILNLPKEKCVQGRLPAPK